MLFLNEQEIMEWTGYKYPADQVKWLKNNHVKFTVDRLGKPKVALSHFNEIMNNKESNEPRRRRTEPNEAALKAYQSGHAQA